MLAPSSAALAAQVLHLNVVSVQAYASASSAASEAIFAMPSAAQHAASMTTAQRTAPVLNDNHAEPNVPHCAIAVQRDPAKRLPSVQINDYVSARTLQSPDAALVSSFPLDTSWVSGHGTTPACEAKRVSTSISHCCVQRQI